MITVFTPSYNRAHTLCRVYESLCSQTFKDFEWIIIDDGSSDNTKEVVDGYKANDNFFEITYVYQKNQGKHIATNNAVKLARGDFFITIDSDDGCKPEALERLTAMWNTIPEEDRNLYKGVSCRCCKVEEPDVLIGTSIGKEYIDSTDHDLRFIHKVKGELWGMTRKKVSASQSYEA